MRIDNHVGHQTFTSKGQVLLSIGHSTSAFLTVTRGELVTDLGNLNSSHLDFDEAFVFVICGQDDLVDVALLRVLERNRLIFKLLLLALLVLVLTSSVHNVSESIVRYRGFSLADNDVVSTYLVGGTNDSVVVQLVVSTVLQPRCFLRVWLTNLFFKRLSTGVSTVKD